MWCQDFRHRSRFPRDFATVGECTKLHSRLRSLAQRTHCGRLDQKLLERHYLFITLQDKDHLFAGSPPKSSEQYHRRFSLFRLTKGLARAVVFQNKTSSAWEGWDWIEFLGSRRKRSSSFGRSRKGRSRDLARFCVFCLVRFLGPGYCRGLQHVSPPVLLECVLRG